MALSSIGDALRSVSVSTAALVGAVSAVSYWSVVFSYRLFFHPYAKYPGPKIAALSELWYAYHWFSGRYPWAVEEAFRTYGDVVRIAPNEVAFFSPQAQTGIVHPNILMAGLRGQPPFIKTGLQRIHGKHAGIAADPDPVKHKAVRKQLAPAFNPRALREQEPALHQHIDGFIDKLAEGSEDGLDMREWFDWLACDIAGDMCYGHDFRNVKDGRSNHFLTAFRAVGLWGTLNQVMKRFQVLYPLVFLALPPSLARVIPTILRENNKIVKARVERRHKLPHPDYFSLLVRGDEPPEQDFLVAQANHLIVGGFDPDTNLFTSGVYFLLETGKLGKLQKEVREKFSSYEEITGETVVDLPWVNAVIEESLRIHTNGAFGLPRISPGYTVDGHYIPKGCLVQTSIFATSHSERFFRRPREFHPERWLPSSHPDYSPLFDTDDKNSFKPFSMGPRGCIGQNMAYLQGRLLFAKMAWKLDWEHVNAGEVDWERDVKLYAMWEKPPVIVRFKEYQQEKHDLLA